jgi:hypothetical protein
MSQATKNIPNQSRTSYRAAVNAALQALATNDSGATAPPETYPFMFWPDTSAGKLKQRDSLNASWVIIGDLDMEALGLLPKAGGALAGILQMFAGADIASAATVDLGSATGNDITITHSSGTTATTGFGGATTIQKGTRIRCRASISGGSYSLTQNATSMKLPGGANITLADGDSWDAVKIHNSNAYWRVENFTRADGTPLINTPALRGYLAGLVMSTAGSSSTMTIGAGQAMDSTNSLLMTLAASINKTTAAWAVGSGNGGLDTATIANSTWYYFYEIRRPDTGVVDVIFSTSSSAPTLPANYTQYRYIGARPTNGSAQWVAFTQSGDEVYWSSPVLDMNGAGSATANLLTLSVPRGRKMKAFLNVYLPTTTSAIYLSDPANADLAPSGTAAPLYGLVADGAPGVVCAGQLQVWTNTSAQVRYRNINSNTIRIATLGFVDNRGRDE